MAGADEEELVEYGDEYITSRDAPVPRWLMWSYLFWIGWGIVWFWLYWNGSWGWLDRGYWNELETVANTRNAVKNYSTGP